MCALATASLKFSSCRRAEHVGQTALGLPGPADCTLLRQGMQPAGNQKEGPGWRGKPASYRRLAESESASCMLRAQPCRAAGCSQPAGSRQPSPSSRQKVGLLSLGLPPWTLDPAPAHVQRNAVKVALPGLEQGLELGALRCRGGQAVVRLAPALRRADQQHGCAGGRREKSSMGWEPGVPPAPCRCSRPPTARPCRVP